MNQVFDLSIDINEYDFAKDSLNQIAQNLWVKNQWPLVYFIKNDEKKIAYIGESTDALNRLTNHLSNQQRAVLKKVSIIGCDKFNKSATLDIESNLIQYISSEGSFTLQNGNNGLTHHNYYQRELYGSLFKEIWKNLIEKKLVSKTLDEIQNSNFFKYSPYKSLNQDQYNSVLQIIDALNNKSATHIFIKGSAGTGKTILATYLIKLLTSRIEDLNQDDVEEDNLEEIKVLKVFRNKYPSLKIGLVIAMTSLRTTLEKVFAKIPGLNKNMILSPSDSFKEKYDILIVDEAHRLRQRKNIGWMGVFTKNNTKLNLGNDGTELDWILANSKHQIFFYDKNQSIKPSDVAQGRFQDLLSKPETIQLELKSQMRVKGGADYITFVDSLLNCTLEKNKEKYIPKEYELRVFDSFKDLYAELSVKEKEFKLCRLIAGYAWPWLTQKSAAKNSFDIEIEGLKFCWNRNEKDWIGSETSFSEIGCIHTTQGYDLNYVGVIFGKEIGYNTSTNQIVINPNNYFDKNGKKGISDPEVLKEYIINIYKTIMYRGIRGAYIYACDEKLKNYLQKCIHFEALKTPFRILRKEEVRPYINCIPLYDISVAAGGFSEEHVVENVDWVEMPEPFTYNKDYFVCKVHGESMNKKIPDGSWCLFKKDPGGIREGKIVLVEHYKIQDVNFCSGFTVKQYHSEKSVGQDSWIHSSIILKPISYDLGYSDIIIADSEIESVKVIGIFVSVL